jgi:histidyl-tRNA synthetase
MLAGDAPRQAVRPVELFVALELSSPAQGGGGEDGQMGLPAGGPVLDRRAARRREAFGLLGAARSAGLTAQMELAGRSLKGQLGHANALGARYVAIVGDGESTLKDMQGGGQEVIATDTVVHAVLRGLRDL